MAAASAIVRVLCVCCVFVCLPWRPPLSPLSMSGMQQEEWGDEREEGEGREARMERWYLEDPAVWGHMACVSVCVIVRYLLSVLNRKVTLWLSLVRRKCAVSAPLPQQWA